MRWNLCTLYDYLLFPLLRTPSICSVHLQRDCVISINRDMWVTYSHTRSVTNYQQHTNHLFTHCWSTTTRGHHITSTGGSYGRRWWWCPLRTPVMPDWLGQWLNWLFVQLDRHTSEEVKWRARDGEKPARDNNDDRESIHRAIISISRWVPSRNQDRDKFMCSLFIRAAAAISCFTYLYCTSP